MIKVHSNKVEKLFKEINQYEKDLNLPFFNQPDYSLDRYSNIKPYIHNKCILPSGKYINASIMEFPDHPIKFILCQAPKKETCIEFGELISSQNVKMIIQLGGENYYKTFLKEKECLHLEFSDWPDHGIPKKEAFLQFYENYLRLIESLKDRINVGEKLTCIVHCSAGVGRTGTFCAFDIASNKMKNAQSVDILEIIKEMRHYRTMLVQTPSQLAFLLQITSQFSELDIFN